MNRSVADAVDLSERLSHFQARLDHVQTNLQKDNPTAADEKVNIISTSFPLSVQNICFANALYLTLITDIYLNHSSICY